jgi:hypothetical protein
MFSAHPQAAPAQVSFWAEQTRRSVLTQTLAAILVDGCTPLYSQRDGRETDISKLDNTGICRLRLYQIAA